MKGYGRTPELCCDDPPWAYPAYQPVEELPTYKVVELQLWIDIVDPLIQFKLFYAKIFP